jgi:tetratricopeptide (TPR) repeat protein
VTRVTRRPNRRGGAAALLVALSLAVAAPAATPAAGAPATRAARPAAKPAARRAVPPRAAPPDVHQLGLAAIAFEEQGAYGLAADKLRAMRAWVPLDADLEIALALDEARSGQLDSAWVRLNGVVLATALVDSAVAARRTDYPFDRTPLWLNGRFDGWSWYVARARAELALRLGRAAEALDAAHAAIRMRPLSGKEHLLAAVAAGRLGALRQTTEYARAARLLDPTLPEAHYLTGLLEWRQGRRNEAGEAFRVAMSLDSTYRAAALARVRCRLPAAEPDSFPSAYLTGVRAAAMLTSPERPKTDEVNQTDAAVTILDTPVPDLPDSVRARLKKPVRFIVTVLVDERGRAVVNELPWFTDADFPYALVPRLVAATTQWRFRPAQRHGGPVRAWGSVEKLIQP